LTDLIDRLGQVRVRIGPFGMVEGEPANEFAIELVCKIAGSSYILLKVILERDKAVVGPVVDVQEFDLTDRRADTRDAQAVLFLQVPDVLDPLGVELHHILDTSPCARIDESKRVVAKPQGGKGAELLHGRLLVGCFVGQSTQEQGSKGLVFHDSRRPYG